MCLWKFKYKIRDIFKTAIRFSKHILTGSLHEGSCILTYIINQANQRKICCITKGTIKLLQFSCSWYKLMQDTHWGNQKSSNPRRNKITKSHSKLAKGKAWIKKKKKLSDSCQTGRLWSIPYYSKQRKGAFFFLQV